jgi:hypothetical protein
MGADLISYIAFGPSTIRMEERKKTATARTARAYLDACVNAAEQLLLGRKRVPAPRPVPVQAKCHQTLRLGGPPQLVPFKSIKELKNNKEYQSLVEQILDAFGYEVEAQHVFSATPEELAKIVKGFVDDWNKPHYRDMASRPDPDDRNRKVVLAGELSWGDEPEGAGYQLLKRAFGLGIAQSLGVK